MTTIETTKIEFHRYDCGRATQQLKMLEDSQQRLVVSIDTAIGVDADWLSELDYELVLPIGLIYERLGHFVAFLHKTELSGPQGWSKQTLQSRGKQGILNIEITINPTGRVERAEAQLRVIPIG